MGWLRNLSTELKIFIGAGAAIIIVVIGATILREKDRVREKNINDARTNNAKKELMDSLKVIRADLDSLKLWTRPFIWILGVITLKGAC